MIKSIITAMTLSTLVLGPAMADTTTTPVTQTMPSSGGFLQQQTTGELRSTKLEKIRPQNLIVLLGLFLLRNLIQELWPEKGKSFLNQESGKSS